MNRDVTGEVCDDALHMTAARHMARILADGFRVDYCGVLRTGAYFDLGSKTVGVVPTRQRYPDQPLAACRCEMTFGRGLDVDREEFRVAFLALSMATDSAAEAPSPTPSPPRGRGHYGTSRGDYCTGAPGPGSSLGATPFPGIQSSEISRL